MPQLDVSFVVSDPMLADRFTVIRRAEVIGEDGRVTTTETTHPNQIGVVTQQDPSDLMRRDDGQFVPRSIFIASRFAFRNAATGVQPDVIIWAGNRFEVKQAYNYSRFGRGLFECVAVSTDAMDQPN